ncbi:unnamed protein product [Urochloa humidicola]
MAAAHRLLLGGLTLALLAIAASGARPAAAVVGKIAVVSLRELDGWGSARQARSGRPNTDAKRAEMLGEHKKTRTATTVLELKHHSLSAIPDDPSARDAYLRRLLAADEARANSLQLQKNRAAASTQSSSGSGGSSTEIPLTSGIQFQTLNYVTTIGLGSGATNLTVIVDTGSDLTWVQCKPCSTCYAQRDPLFDPAASATYAAVHCNAPACAASLKAATGTPGSCASASNAASDKCYYALGYGDGSFSRGVLATDTLALGAAARLEGFVFGCGLSNRGLFGGAAGLVGLGRTELSLVSQTSSRYGGAFSYCLPASTTTAAASSGSLSLGADTSSYRNKTAIAYTRMIADPAQPPFYFLNITGAAVGGKPVTASGLGAGNVLIDSGTVITRLVPSVYAAVRAEFARQFGGYGYRAAPGFSILDACYDLSGKEEVKVPVLTLTMEGGAEVEVDAAGMLFVVRKDGSQVCLAMAGLPYEDQTPIIGNYQQKNKRVVYDTVGARIGFADEDCSFV